MRVANGVDADDSSPIGVATGIYALDAIGMSGVFSTLYDVDGIRNAMHIDLTCTQLHASEKSAKKLQFVHDAVDSNEFIHAR
jgi:hypothetical protein